MQIMSIVLVSLYNVHETVNHSGTICKEQLKGPGLQILHCKVCHHTSSSCATKINVLGV